MPSQPGFKKTLDLIKLSDAFRRHAYDCNKDYKVIKELVAESRRFSGFATWYAPTEQFRHKKLSENLQESLTRIAKLAEKLDVDEVQLPITGDRRSSFTEFFNSMVKPANTSSVDIHLQRGTYTENLSTLGKIDRRIKTSIDEGARGLANISTNVLSRW